MKYKATVFFLLTYIILNPIVYYLFGNAYIASSHSENYLLVFLCGPFSFSESINVNVPFGEALLLGFTSLNFIVPALVLFLAEKFLPGGYSIAGRQFTAGRSYGIAIGASYLLSAVIWGLFLPHEPTTGTSIIAFSLIMTFAVGYPLSYWAAVSRGKKRLNGVKLLVSVFLLIIGGGFALLGYVLGNSAVLLHGFGFLIYIVLSLITLSLLGGAKKDEEIDLEYL